jgi:hypothetical protein
LFLESNAAAADIDLAPGEIEQLDAAFPFDAAAGERYAPDMMRWLDTTPGSA